MNVKISVGSITLAFIVLKLCNVIAWSWWWVFSPLWISGIMWLALFAFLWAVSEPEKKVNHQPYRQRWKLEDE